jgi:putative transposase
MGPRRRYEVPDGWVARGFRFEVEPTNSDQAVVIRQQFGGRRYAYNWALAQVRANLDARAADPTVPALVWSLPAIRRQWNQAKDGVAPWWRCCSKECYASGIADLVAALHNWSDAQAGRRAGGPVSFPRFKARHRDRGRVRFTTGAMRLEPDRRHLTLPVTGKLRSKENTRRLQRLVANGRARILSMTLTEQGGSGRLFVSVQTIIAHRPGSPREPGGRCGIDLGIGHEWAVIAHHDDTIERAAYPASWTHVQQQRRRIARQQSRRIVGSRGHRQANAKLAALDRRAANLRTHHTHLLTTGLARRYGTIVVEDLDVAAMGRGMGRRAFRRSVYQAGLGKVRSTLAYKTLQEGGRLLVADRWFASSKTHHGCGGYLADLKLGQRTWICPSCRAIVDRNANAALNLRDWTGPVGDRVVQRGGVAAPVPFVGDHGGQAHVQRGACEASEDHRTVAGADDTKTKPPWGEEPRAGVPVGEHAQILTEPVTGERAGGCCWPVIILSAYEDPALEGEARSAEAYARPRPRMAAMARSVSRRSGRTASAPADASSSGPNGPVATATTRAPPARPAATSSGVSPTSTVAVASNAEPYLRSALRRATSTRLGRWRWSEPKPPTSTSR